MIYLDQAATSWPKPPEVLWGVTAAMQNCTSVGRSGHRLAQHAAEIVYDCRCLAGELFDTEPDRVVFTSNATHGLNIAINTLINPRDRVVISGFEHNAVVRPLHHLGAKIITAGEKLFDPRDTLDSFDRAITGDTKAVICTHVSNVFGYILPVEKIAELCRIRNVPFILDASQSAGVLPVSLKKLGAAFIAMPGHKSLLGPPGTGILLCNLIPKPLIFGGTGSLSQEQTMPDFLPDLAEAGTHNISGIAGLKASLNYLKNIKIETIHQHERTLLVMIYDLLKQHPDLEIFYGGPDVQTGTLSFHSKAMDCQLLDQKFSDQDIAVRAGLHCAPLAHKTAGTLQTGTVRISIGAMNNFTDLHGLGQFLKN